MNKRLKLRKNRTNSTKNRAIVEVYREVSATAAAHQGDVPRPAASSNVKCGGCRHGLAFQGRRHCTSLISPRAGFHHAPSFACGYGREIEAGQVSA